MTKTLIELIGNSNTRTDLETIQKAIGNATKDEKKNIVFYTNTTLLDFSVVEHLNFNGFIASQKFGISFIYNEK